MGSIAEYVFVILSQRKAYAGRFQKETAGKRTGPITKWQPRRLLFTRLEIVFVTISSFTKRTKVVPKVFQESECCLEGLINHVCWLQLQMLPRLNGHFIVWFSVVHHCFAHIDYTKKRPTQSLHNYKTTLSYYNR